MPNRLIAGAMSGTSADGVDVAVCDIAGRGVDVTIKLLGSASRAYDAGLRKRIFEIRTAGSARLCDLCELGRRVTLAYADAVRDACGKVNISPRDLAAVAAHGQTLFHDPPHTIQQFDPSLLAAELNCVVVSDLRRADLAVGGEGAPLVPLGDFVMFKSNSTTRLLLNVGGISNLTLLPAGGGVDSVLAFDTGPGNCISDAVCRAAGFEFDENGRRAACGKANDAVVNAFCASDFVRRPPPKSTDGPAMIQTFTSIVDRVSKTMSLDDRLATAARIVARSIRLSIDLHLQHAGSIGEVIVAGGGTRNAAVMNELRQAFAPTPVVETATLGVPTDLREAMAFAVLGAATLDGVPGNLPRVTGAARPVVLGSITPKPD